mgnify:CR=1 FL=1
MSEAPEQPRFEARELWIYARDLLVAGGFHPEHADKTADVLIWANLRGAESHGVLRIPRYAEMITLGMINPHATPAIAASSGSLSLMEADGAPGAVGMSLAAKEALRLARTHGLGWCSARNISHAGAIGYYLLELAEAGFVGIAMTASGPLMAYHGSRNAALSTNPLAIVAPQDGADPILLDMSTSTAPLGKVLAAKDAGATIPPDWAIDAEGQPTTDARKAVTLQPLGGAKGSGLSLMIEILCSVLVGNPIIEPALRGVTVPRQNGIVIAADPSRFGSLDQFRGSVAALAREIRGLPRAVEDAELLLPGDRGFATARRNMDDGIPLPQGTVTRLAKMAETHGVKVPAPL